jgi:hypothetical protein
MNGFGKIQAQVREDAPHNILKCNLLYYLQKDTMDLGRTRPSPPAPARTGKIRFANLI